MAPGPMDFNTSNQPNQGEDRKHFSHEMKEMASALTRRLTNFHHTNKPNSHPMDHLDEDDHGLGVITLAGNNIGATMRGEFDNMEGETDQGMSINHKAMTTYANSNFQAVNNSVMLNASYSSHDPGIHIEYVEPLVAHDEFGKTEDDGKKKGKKKKGGKETSKGGKHSDASSSESSED